MKGVLKALITLLMIGTFAISVKSQTKVSDANIVNQLFDLVKCDTTVAFKFYRDKKCELVLRQDVKQPGFVMSLSKYRAKGEANSYMLSNIRDKIISAGYITYQLDEYDGIMKKILDIGFKLNEKAGAGTTKIVYQYDKFSFIIEKHTDVQKPFYVFALSDMVKTQQGMAGK